MVRWLQGNASPADAVPQSSWVALLPALIFFCICVSMVLALCAARGSGPGGGLTHPELHSWREPGGELAAESRKLSHRFSSTSAITKLSASFRISSFRDPPSSSFRISSFRTDCRQVDVVDAFRRTRPAVEESDSSTEPAVWQRVILRGERCAPLSFSGLILYDENGNHLPTLSSTPAEQDLRDNHPQPRASSEQHVLN